MKLLMVSHYFDSHPGGIEFVARELFSHLDGPKCDVTWLAADVNGLPKNVTHGRTIPLSCWNLVEKTIGLPFPVPSLRALKRLWCEVDGSDVVLLHDCLYLSNIATFIFCRIRCVPVAIVQHISIVPYRSLIATVLMKLANRIVTCPMLRSAQQVLFISQITKSYFSDLQFSCRPVLAFNGVDTDVFFPALDNFARARLREKFGLPGDRRVVLFVGRFVEKKGLPLMKYMAELAPDILWVFAGSGPLHPQEWGLPNIRHFSGLRGSSLADLYRTSNVLVLPSTGEGFPLVIQEALACGIPVVCSSETVAADGALKEFVRGVPLNSKNNEKCAKDFVVAIREALNENTSSDVEKRAQFAKSRYSWPGAAKLYYEILSELTSVYPRDRYSNSAVEALHQ